MNKGPSEYAEYWISDQQEIDHFDWHAYDMGYYLIKDYSKSAMKFAKIENENIISFTAKNGSIYKYNLETNEFIILSIGGKIVTYYYPDRKLDYFYDQFSDKGNYWNK